MTRKGDRSRRHIHRRPVHVGPLSATREPVSAARGPVSAGRGPATAGRRSRPVTVLVVGGRGEAYALARHLPYGWSVSWAETVATTADADIMVVYGATGPAVAVAVRRHPAATVLGVVSAGEPVDVMVDVLEAGADACVRDAGAPVIVGHLRACHRRRAAA
jgi:hypothetical protein